MASTNKTTYYELSQFIGTDKPAWLSDYNTDMGKIDAGIKNASDTATSASGTATSASNAIGTLSNLTTTEKSTLVGAINEVDGNADTAQGTANDAYYLANVAGTKIASLESALNLTNVSNCTATGYNTTNVVANTFKCATNSAKSLFKIYGSVVVYAVTGTQIATVTLSNTGLGARNERYKIEGCGLSFRGNGAIDVLSCYVETNGDISIIDLNFDGTDVTRVYFMPCLYFDDNFGD